MLSLMLHLYNFILLYNKQGSCIWYHLMESCMRQLLKIFTWKRSNLFWLLKYIYGSIIWFDESDKLCWKHEIILFWWCMRVRGSYIGHSMSDIRCKSGEIIDIYVHIIASWLQLIYIFLWVFVTNLGNEFCIIFCNCYQRMYDYIYFLWLILWKDLCII